MIDHPLVASTRPQFEALGEPLAAALVAAMNFAASIAYASIPELMTHWAAIVTALAGALVTLLTAFSIGLKIVKQWRELPPPSHESRLKRATRIIFRRK